jgi:hypothetical protein
MFNSLPCTDPPMRSTNANCCYYLWSPLSVEASFDGTFTWGLQTAPRGRQAAPLPRVHRIRARVCRWVNERTEKPMMAGQDV